jgi:hypothetical protein
MRSKHLSVAALLLAGVLSACGSTVQTVGSQQAAGGGTTGLGLDPSASPTQGGELGGTSGGLDSSTGTGGTSGSGTGSTSGTSTTSGTSGGQVGTSGGTSGGQATSGANGPGVTATEIRLGIPYCNDCAAGNAGLGAAGEDPGDTRRYYKAALDEVNARGGVLGRKLVPVWHQISVSDDITRSQQEACEAFTKDNKVFAIFFRGEIVYSCALKAGIIAWGGGASGEVFARYPNLFAPSSIRFERLAAVTVKAMVRAGWQKPDAKYPTGKIGLNSCDNPEYRYSMNKGWLPSLHQAGLKETDVRYVAIPADPGTIGDASAAISSAVLRFRQEGIDHVFISDGPAGIFAGTGLTLLFLQSAQAQSYKPRYGFNTQNSPDYDNHPQEQLVDMLAVDSSSTEAANDAGIPLNAQRERCFAIMKKKGLPVGQSQTQNVAEAACEFAWFTEAIVKASRSTLLRDVIAGGESLGTSYQSPWQYGTKIGPGQHDGTQLFRNLRYDEPCKCMKYTSKPYEP